MNKSTIRTGAIALLLMAAAAIAAYGIIHSSLVIPGDAQMTHNNIQANSKLFSFEIILWVVVIITDILASWAFYIIFASINKQLSLLAALCRLIYTAMLAIAVYSLTMALHSSSTAVTIQFISGFESIWGLGLIIFGMHLFLLGYMAIEKSYPKWISWLLMAAGAAYSVIHILQFAAPELLSFTEILEMTMMLPMTAAELGLAIWLLIRGQKTLLNAA